MIDSSKNDKEVEAEYDRVKEVFETFQAIGEGLWQKDNKEAVEEKIKYLFSKAIKSVEGRLKKEKGKLKEFINRNLEEVSKNEEPNKILKEKEEKELQELLENRRNGISVDQNQLDSILGAIEKHNENINKTYLGNLSKKVVKLSRTEISQNKKGKKGNKKKETTSDKLRNYTKKEEEFINKLDRIKEEDLKEEKENLENALIGALYMLWLYAKDPSEKGNQIEED